MVCYTFGLFFALLGLVILLFGARTLYVAKSSESWPSVNGVITLSEMKKVQRRSSDNRRLITYYHAKFSFDYQINGVTHSNNLVRVGDWISTNNRSKNINILNRYPVGKSVKVFYGPKALNDGVLEPGLYLDIWRIFGSGGFFFLMAYFFKVGFGFNKIGNIITIGRILMDTAANINKDRKKISNDK